VEITHGSSGIPHCTNPLRACTPFPSHAFRFKQIDAADAIAIRDMTTGAIKTVRKGDTVKIQTGGTLMPDGLTATLTERDLAHLIRYLSELGR
jgi:hypothetical protein